MRPPAGPASAAQGTSDKPQDDGLESRGIGRRASLPRRESPPGARSARLGSPARLRGRALAPAQLEVGSRQARKPSSFSLVFHTFYTDFWAQLMGIPLPSKPNTVKLGWDGGVFGLLKGLWPTGVVGAFDVPFGHLAFDDSGCCASAPDRVEACDQAAQEGQPLSTTCVVVVRGEKRSGAPRTGGGS